MKNNNSHVTTRFSLLHKQFATLTFAAIAVFGAAFSIPANARDTEATRKPATVFQVSTLPALSLGLYDGTMSFGEVLQHGDFGVGTFHALDGEGIILDGKVWRVRSDGRVFSVGKKEMTPFAVVTNFEPDHVIKIKEPLEYSALLAKILSVLPTPNAPYAIEVRGTFGRIKVRSVPGQQKPYPPLSEVVKTQSEWEWEGVKGNLVGFRFPSYLSGVNLADNHFHFISDDKKRGGHLLNCELQSGQIRIQTIRGFDMELPKTKEFDQLNLSADQSATLKAAESAGKK